MKTAALHYFASAFSDSSCNCSAHVYTSLSLGGANCNLYRLALISHAPGALTTMPTTPTSIYVHVSGERATTTTTPPAPAIVKITPGLRDKHKLCRVYIPKRTFAIVRTIFRYMTDAVYGVGHITSIPLELVFYIAPVSVLHRNFRVDLIDCYYEGETREASLSQNLTMLTFEILR